MSPLILTGVSSENIVFLPEEHHIVLYGHKNTKQECSNMQSMIHYTFKHLYIEIFTGSTPMEIVFLVFLTYSCGIFLMVEENIKKI